MIEIFILSLIQGITEFLPVSSSSHLILVSKYLNFDEQSLSIDVSLHIGSFIAVLFYFYKDIINFFERDSKELRLVGGCVRDAFLGRKTKDIDLAAKAKPNEII